MGSGTTRAGSASSWRYWPFIAWVPETLLPPWGLGAGHCTSSGALYFFTASCLSWARPLSKPVKRGVISRKVTHARPQVVPSVVWGQGRPRHHSSAGRGSVGSPGKAWEQSYPECEPHVWFSTSSGATFLLKSRKEWAKLILMYLCNLIHSCSGTQSCPTLCSPMDCSMPGFFVLHCLLEFAEIHVGSVMPSSHLIHCHPLLLPSVSPSNSLFQWVSSSHQVPRVLELQFQHQSLQWIFRIDFL